MALGVNDMTITEIGGRKCFCHARQESRYLLIQPVDEHDASALQDEVAYIEQLAEEIPFTLCAFQVGSWFSDLSPWTAPPVFGHQAFGDDAGRTLAYIEHELIPSIEESMSGQPVRRIIGGYSLAGLFALYAAYETDTFSGCAGVSPSVWFPDWDTYTDEHPFGAAFAYLSLGDREEKTKNRQMAMVGERIRQQAAKLQALSRVRRCTLEWNAGNHFVDSDLRMAKGFAWLLREMDHDAGCM